ncbi:hypothetical protein HOY80DRAFT_922054 [Tuber brumale]|nr:hypothetical protein HOY80DRAFT_922054 [Tuber brumale]
MPNINDSISKSADTNVPLAEPSPPPQPPSTWPSKPDAHPNTRPTFSTVVDRYIIIASFVCLLAILVYILSSSRDIFSLHK